MNENGDTPPLETVVCGRCAAACDFEDNFCRHCGLSLHDEAHLPSLRDGPRLPALRQPSVPATVVKGAAFVAAGKLAEVLVRHLVRGALQRAPGRSKLPAQPAQAELAPREDSMPEEASVISETFLMRRIRIRR